MNNESCYIWNICTICTFWLRGLVLYLYLRIGILFPPAVHAGLLLKLLVMLRNIVHPHYNITFLYAFSIIIHDRYLMLSVKAHKNMIRTRFHSSNRRHNNKGTIYIQPLREDCWVIEALWLTALHFSHLGSADYCLSCVKDNVGGLSCHWWLGQTFISMKPNQ